MKTLWVARDKDNGLYLYEFKPERHYDKWYDWDNGTFYGMIELDKKLFPNLIWDNEPIEVELSQVFKTREYSMVNYLKQAYSVADEGDNWITNDAMGGRFCREIKKMIMEVIERITKDIQIYNITE